MKTIALSMRRADALEYDEARDAISHDWISFLEDNGFEPLIVPNVLKNPESLISRYGVAGIILSNGEDVPTHPAGGEADFRGPREMTELRLLEYAVRTQTPLLGVCRGMHFINLYFGGDVKNCSAVSRVPGEHVAVCHTINAADEYCCNSVSVFTVNSYHHKCLTFNSLSPSLRAFATDAEGLIIEGFYHPDLPIAGIQWHPERSGSSFEIDRALLDKLFVRGGCGVTTR